MKVLWQPSSEFSNNSNLRAYQNFVEKKFNFKAKDYSELHQWSTENIEDFWLSILQYFEVQFEGDFQNILSSPSSNEMIGSKWFEGISVSYAEHIFSNFKDGKEAIFFKNETGHSKSISWNELKHETEKFVSYFKSLGLGLGAKICSFTPNIPQTVSAFLACNAIGGIWSSCSPDFGTASVADRFKQINPDLLIVSNGYWYNGKAFDKTASNKELAEALPSIKAVLQINYCTAVDTVLKTDAEVHHFEDLPASQLELSFTRTPFNDPIWVLYSSGTTGIPKAITHSVGGVLIEHLKALSIHQNVKKDEVFFWYSTTGWMMWNYANAALLVGGRLAIYDGSPALPNLNTLWEFAKESNCAHFGAGASFYISCMKAGITIDQLPSLKSLGSTGSPLTPEAFSWLYQNIKEDLWVVSLSGGTDICSGFVGGNPYDPVVEGEIQCRMLGVDLAAFDEQGNEKVDELGEMVVKQPMPSMPIYFWGDDKNSRYHESYFAMYPGAWRHGDWIKISERGSLVIYGRSDSTLNRGGVRIGTSEVYNAVDTVEEVADAIVVCIDKKNGDQKLILCTQLTKGQIMNAELQKKIATQLRKLYSPRHVPDQIIEVSSIPYTMSGKKMEKAVKQILSGKEAKLSKDSMKNPESLEQYYALLSH